MKALISVFTVIALGVAFTLFAQADAGFIIIGRGHWQLETSLAAALLLLGLSAGLSLWLWALIRWLRRQWFILQHPWSPQRVQQVLQQAAWAFIRQDWLAAEQILAPCLPHAPAFATLTAAHAAAMRQDWAQMEACLAHLTPTLETREQALLSLCAVQWYATQGQMGHALSNARIAYRHDPDLTPALKLLIKLLVQEAAWADVLEHLPAARKQKAFPETYLQQLQQQAWAARLQTAQHSEPDQIAALWAQVPSELHTQPAVLLPYVQHLRASGDSEQAEALLRAALNQHWDSQLVQEYGLLQLSSAQQVAQQLSAWLKIHSGDAVLMRVLGEVYLQQQAYESALHWLTQSYQRSPSAAVCKALGDYYVQQQVQAQALSYYQEGLRRAAGR